PKGKGHEDPYRDLRGLSLDRAMGLDLPVPKKEQIARGGHRPKSRRTEGDRLQQARLYLCRRAGGTCGGKLYPLPTARMERAGENDPPDRGLCDEKPEVEGFLADP